MHHRPGAIAFCCHHIDARVSVAVSRRALCSVVVDFKAPFAEALAQVVYTLGVTLSGWVQGGNTNEILSERNQVIPLVQQTLFKQAVIECSGVVRAHRLDSCCWAAKTPVAIALAIQLPATIPNSNWAVSGNTRSPTLALKMRSPSAVVCTGYSARAKPS